MTDVAVRLQPRAGGRRPGHTSRVEVVRWEASKRALDEVIGRPAPPPRPGPPASGGAGRAAFSHIQAADYAKGR